MDKCWFLDDFFFGCNVMRLFGLMSFPVKSELCILFALAHYSA